ncbi:cellulose biosynthesis protein BcsN [Rhizobium sp. S152]|uniref:cellulose biosynthesis protein BcsN n=1 Tax=Rhizobium sp. S152 TaxID=3055038 RepID=UPI0025A9E53A|nr:cellulose biosynthesis protein BcsN [Rhizobium sp. S152]MDM9628714.1 cellulose biosynthesis protein BcsN [Rhizobium sp. S152]
MKLLRMISLAGLAGMLAACTSSGNVRLPNAAETVASEQALALPPPGGPSIVSVVQHRRGNGVEQNISLFTSSSVQGQNFLKIQMLGASGSTSGTGGAPYRMISESGISREMFAAAPGVPMTRSATFLQNSYGPFGYASGRSRDGDTCIFAWQQIRSSRSAMTQARNFGMIQVRLRLCDARATERQLLAVVYGYTIIGTLDGEIWNPYGPQQGADPTIGRTGSPIYPDAGGYREMPMGIGYEPQPTVISRAPAVRRAAAPARAAPVQAAPVLPQPIGPRVPLPDTNGDAQQSGTVTAPSPTSATVRQQTQTTNASGVSVPSPDCIGDAAMTAACRR